MTIDDDDESMFDEEEFDMVIHFLKFLVLYYEVFSYFRRIHFHHQVKLLLTLKSLKFQRNLLELVGKCIIVKE